MIELVRELVISNMHDRFEDDTWKTFQVIAPTRSNYWRKMRKIVINLPFWKKIQPLLNLSKNYLWVTCITNLKRIREKTFQVIAPTRSNYCRKMREIAINRPFLIFFQPLLSLSKNYLLVTCITNLKRISEKLFNLSRPKVNVNADADELQLQ